MGAWGDAVNRLEIPTLVWEAGTAAVGEKTAGAERTRYGPRSGAQGAAPAGVATPAGMAVGEGADDGPVMVVTGAETCPGAGTVPWIAVCVAGVGDAETGSAGRDAAPGGGVGTGSLSHGPAEDARGG